MPRGWFSGPGIGVLDARYLMLDCTNDPLTAGLEINAATLTEPVLILQTTDDNAANPLLDCQNAAGATLSEIQSRGGLNFAAAVGQATPGLVGLAGSRFFHMYGARNLFIGVNAGNFTLAAASENVALGENALDALTDGIRSMAVGYSALTAVTSGPGNIGIGWNAGASLTTGGNNVVLGTVALGACIVGSQNFAMGYFALRFAIGTNNVAIGWQSLGAQTTPWRNVGIGNESGRYNVIGANNCSVGEAAGRGTIANSYSGSLFMAYRAGYAVTTGSYVVALGFQAGYNIGAGSYCVFIGPNAGYNENTSNKLYIANSNTATPLIYGEFNTWRLAFGNQYAVDKYGELAHASGYFAAIGDAQASPDSFIVRRAVASHAVNTWYPLYPDGGTTPERLTIAADSMWMVDVLVIGLTQNTAQQWAYQIIGVLERDNAGNTTLAVQTVATHFESDANYDTQLVADDANEALEVQVRRTGGVDYDIRWVATIRHVQAGYP